MVPQSIPCNSQHPCDNILYDDCLCDYTSINNLCGQPLDGSQAGCLCNQTELCNTEKYPWHDIKVGTHLYQELNAGQYNHYRFILDKPCTAAKITVSALYGDPFLYVSTSGPAAPDSYDWEYINFDMPVHRYLCPDHSGFALGTFFVAVRAANLRNVAYYIEVTTEEIPYLNVVPDSSACALMPEDLQSTHTCIEDSIPMHATCPDLAQMFYYYEEHSTECLSIQVKLDIVGSDGADMDLYVAINDKFSSPAFTFSDFFSYLISDDDVSFVACPKSECWLLNANNRSNDYTLYITSKNKERWTYKPLTSLAPYSGNFALQGSSRLHIPGDKTLLCEERTFNCNEFWPSMPFKHNTPFWPIPTIMKQIDYSLNVNQQPFAYEPKEYIYMATLIVSYQLNGGTYVSNVAEDDLGEVDFEVLPLLTNNLGEPFKGIFKARRIDVGCSYSEFLWMKDFLMSIINDMDRASSLAELISLKYTLETVQFNSSWQGCTTELDGAMLSSLVTTEEDSLVCLAAYNSDECMSPAVICIKFTFHPDNNDPCCALLAGWSSTCSPRLANITRPVNQKVLQDSCHHAECMESYLEDYAQMAKATDDGALCNTAADVVKQYSVSVTDKYRACKNVFNTAVTCYTDSDCSIYATKYPLELPVTCDIISGKCNIAIREREEAFVRCLLDQMDIAQQQYIGDTYNITGGNSDETYFENLLSVMTYNVCATDYSLNLGPYRDHYKLAVYDQGCADVGGCPSLLCEDDMCEVQENACISWCAQYEFTFVAETQHEHCLEATKCNWDDTMCNNDNTVIDATQCTALCQQPSEFFCGICNDDASSCKRVDGVTSDSECTETSVCLYPVWMGGSLRYNLTQAECEGLGTCTKYPTNFKRQYFFFLNSKRQCEGEECQTELDCIVKSGSCSDTELIKEGACVLPRLLPLVGGKYEGFLFLPFCEIFQTAVPNGCADFSIVNTSDCEIAGGTWWSPATDETSCMSQHGCYDIQHDKYTYGVQHAFSPKSRVDCESPYNFGGKWAPYFNWVRGTWVPGIYKKPTWTPARAVPAYNYRSSLNFKQLEDAFVSGSAGYVAQQTKSDALCKLMPSLQALQTFACDCSTTSANFNDGTCFAGLAAIPITSSRPCFGESTTVTSTGLVMRFSENSVSQGGCTNVVVSKVSALQYEAKPQIRLTNFVTFATPESFAVTNKKGAVIGTLLGDGVEIEFRGAVANVTLCMAMRTSPETIEKYNVLDFAFTDLSYGELVPYNLKGVKIEDDMVCGEIEYEHDFAGSRSYFPIVRKQNWETQRIQFFSKSVEGLIYTLAALFSICAVIAFLVLLDDGYQLYHGRTTILPKFLLVLFIFLFTLIRAISFFLVPSGVSSNTLDYILVVLPTFFYFTAFTLVVLTWAIVTKETQKLLSYRTIKLAAITVNALLYILFIVVVVVFQYTERPPQLSCGGRVHEKISNNTQRAVSILYAVLIAVISLITGVLFIYYGKRLINTVTAAEKITKSGFNEKSKIFYTTLMCSTSFILHCVFSFIGLIVTEIAPSIYFVLNHVTRSENRFFRKTIRVVASLHRSNSKESKDSRELSMSSFQRSTSSSYKEKESKESKEVKEAIETIEAIEVNVAREVKQVKEAIEVKETKETKEVQIIELEAKETKEAEEEKEAQEVKENEEVEETQEKEETKETEGTQETEETEEEEEETERTESNESNESLKFEAYISL